MDAPDPAAITTFTGAHRFLSNFSPVTVWLDGVCYQSIEHAYQAAKTLNPQTRATFLLIDAGGAKRLGRRIALRPDWDDVKLEIMRALITQKFSRSDHPSLVTLLLATQPHELVEGNSWHDVFWGRCTCEKHGGVGENHLGRLLMERRDALWAAEGETP